MHNIFKLSYCTNMFKFKILWDQKVYLCSFMSLRYTTLYISAGRIR
ncbi:hypothetical protein MIJ3_00295 [Pseudomonas phage vB_PaeM_MIJ3]|nr:hypothetical protein GBBBJNDB_00299 [Pseudomonas phage Callisto]VOH55426.1 hypothetical protein MIJ3_00295 [Pseudomonas phage vB_PaeM_MIJ3]